MALGLAVLLSILQVAAAGPIQPPHPGPDPHGPHGPPGPPGLTVDTTSGPVQGYVDKSLPNVAQYLGIPYAEQPVGDRRWIPSIRKKREMQPIDGSRFGHACPQYEADEIKFPSVWLTDAPEHVITPRDYQGEDCLSVNIWSPHSEGPRGPKESKLPVVAWIHGGSFRTGGATVPYQNPGPWVQRTGKHIVVGINYRVGIFGFPNAAGLAKDQQNLGLLDQRVALEWIRDNIAKFGGDPKRITLWGQSAGAMSVDLYNFAYPQDPIVAGLIMDSGTSLLPLVNADFEQKAFASVATQFGCGSKDAKGQVDCLRKINANDIQLWMKSLADNGTDVPSFSPIVDERTHFSNYTARAIDGKYSRKPAIIGTNTNEGIVFLPYEKVNGPSQEAGMSFTSQVFHCPAVKTTQDRYATKSTTFRYLYAGNFTNISPQWWEGAYHSAELPMLFGTYGMARGAGSEFQKAVSEKMQDYWLTFAEDPVNGLPKAGWNKYEPNNDLPLFALDDRIVQPIAESKMEAPCNGAMPNGQPLPY